VEDSCKWCCMNTSAEDSTCRPYKFAVNSTLPDRTPCVIGYCDQVGRFPHTLLRNVGRGTEMVQVTPLRRTLASSP